MKLRVLSAQEVRKALPMKAAIEGMKSAFSQFSAGRAVMPIRSRIDAADGIGTSLFMPGYLPCESADAAEPGTLAVKAVSVFGDNSARGLPTIHALVLLLEADTGRPLALLEGAALTAIRTGAASGAATELLARPDTKTAAIFGSGVQARTQLEAVCSVRPIESVWVYSRNRQRAETFAAEMTGKGPIPDRVHAAENPTQAIRKADVICTATTSGVPVFDGRQLIAGAHVNAVGSFTPEAQEVDAETIRRSRVVVDSREAALEEAGDLLVPMEQGLFSEDQIHAELGEIVSGQREGRTSPRQITYFKSCGLAVQDVAAARICYAEAKRLDLGTTVEL